MVYLFNLTKWIHKCTSIYYNHKINNSSAFHDVSNLLFSAPCSIKACFSSSRSGLSRATTIPKSWSCMPSGVIMKFNNVTCKSKNVYWKFTGFFFPHYESFCVYDSGLHPQSTYCGSHMYENRTQREPKGHRQAWLKFVTVRNQRLIMVYSFPIQTGPISGDC